MPGIPLDDALVAQQRHALLAELGILGDGADPAIDALTQAAAGVTGCPIALVSLIDGDRLAFKSWYTLPAEESPLHGSFCAQMIAAGDVTQVHDALADPRFAVHPLVTGEPHIRFYAGHPLHVDGLCIGTLCVIDMQPRALDAAAQAGLRALSLAATALLVERRVRMAGIAQQSRLTDFVMMSGDWLWETDASHRVVWVSSAYATDPQQPVPWTLGETMTDGPVLDVCGDPLAPATTLHRLMDQRQGFTRVVVRTCPEPAPQDTLHSAVSRHDAAGAWCGYRGTGRDMRPTIAAEQGRRHAAALLAELSSQVPGLIFQMRRGSDGRFSLPYVSEHLESVFELDAVDVATDAAAAFARSHADDAGRITASLQQSARALSPWRESFRVVLPVRGERMLSGHAQPTRLADGAVLWHGLLTDVTDQVQEAEQRQSLRLAHAAAERSAQVRSEFMSRVSHELRTPLNAVLGFAQLLRANGATQPRAEVVKSATQIVRAGGHLLSLIDDLLDLSSLDAGRPDLHLGPVALAPLLQRGAGLMAAHAEAQHMRIAVRADPDSPTVHGDARAIQQVLFNLLGNAIKFGKPHTAVAVTLSHEEALGHVSFAVADQGLGIAADKLAVIFEPFTRVHSGARAPVGSGLGLAITQKLVAAMGGQIAVASEPGHGSVFTVQLPVDGRPAPAAPPDSSFAGLNDLLSPLAVGAASATAPVPAAASAPAPAPASASALNDARVLYIEDDPVNALLMQAFFQALPSEMACASLDIAENGLDGLGMASRSPPDLVLLDLHLPDLDGAEVLRRLRGDPNTARIPVIAVSADAMAEQINEARRAGFDGYWTKPVDIRLVHAEIARRFAVRPTS